MKPGLKFDSMRAWNEALALIRANREVIVVLAGVFFFLPSFASALLMAPAPVPPDGASSEELSRLMFSWFDQTKWWIIGSALATDFGTLAILSLLRGAARPTVGEALSQGFVGLLSLELTKMIVFVALGAAGLVIALVGATGLTVLVPILLILLVLVSIAVSIRTCLTAPLIAVEGLRAPVHVLRRSWQLTYGNAWPVLVFFTLATLAYLVMAFVVGKLVDLAVLTLAGDEAARFASAGLEGLFSAMFLTLVTAMLGATHRQLAAPTRSDPAAAI